MGNMRKQARGRVTAFGRTILLTAVVLILSRTGEGSLGSRGRSLVSSDRSAPAGFRASMQLLEPSNLSKTERVQHHVQASLARAATLNSRRLLKRSDTNYTSDVTSDNAYGLLAYVMSIQLGTPPQTFRLIPDTGSDLVWVQAKECTTCFNLTDIAYDPTASSTYRSLTCGSNLCSILGDASLCNGTGGSCQYGYGYGDQTTTFGYFATETITLNSTDGSLHRVHNFAFGAGLQNAGLYSGSDIDGFAGLGQGPYSFVSQLGERFGRVFSYCLVTFSDSPNQSSPIIFGPASVPKENIQYTPVQPAGSGNDSSYTFWYLQLHGISVSGQNVSIKQDVGGANQSQHNIFIDSDTTFSRLEASTYAALSSALDASIGYPRINGTELGFFLSDCYNVSGVTKPIFPGATFHFENADWVIPPENIFVEVEDGILCLAMAANSFTDIDSQIFGSFQHQNFQVVYDQANSRVGWLAAECDSL